MNNDLSTHNVDQSKLSDNKNSSVKAAAQAAPQVVQFAPERSGRGADSILGGMVICIQIALALCGLGLIVMGFQLEPNGAIHEIYQLMSITSGLTLFGVVGVWGAIDELRRRL